MKKFNLKAFTLVEMLIVIVIIGILIAALLPRMQAAQGRARDVARKTALSQIQSAIVTYQGDTWKRPTSGETLANDSKNAPVTTDTEWLESILKNAWMTDVPKDPLAQQSFGWLEGWTSNSWGFLYMVSERNGTTNGWFILMAKTEVPGWSNWVVCSGTNNSGTIMQGSDLATVKPCRDVVKGDDCKNENKWETCNYKELSELRYIILY